MIRTEAHWSRDLVNHLLPIDVSQWSCYLHRSVSVIQETSHGSRLGYFPTKKVDSVSTDYHHHVSTRENVEDTFVRNWTTDLLPRENRPTFEEISSNFVKISSEENPNKMYAFHQTRYRRGNSIALEQSLVQRLASDLQVCWRGFFHSLSVF